jgi:hypothetical protein
MPLVLSAEFGRAVVANRIRRLAGALAYLPNSENRHLGACPSGGLGVRRQVWPWIHHSSYTLCDAHGPFLV